MRRALFQVAIACLVSAAARAESPTFTFDGDAPTDSTEFFTLPFTVPEGTVEIEVDHGSCLTSGDILDWGVNDEQGHFRGWGGGNSEPAYIGVDRASRSYLTGAIHPGAWTVLVGKAQVPHPPAQYHVDIYLRTTATQPAQPDRRPYVPAPAITKTPGWFMGDLHVHDRESGDASATLDQVAADALGHGLQWVELSDHNTISQLDYIDSYQEKYPNLLFLPGVEWTTYHGHANGIGATQFVDHTTGWNNITAEGSAQQFVAQGAIFSPNHPLLNLPSLCTGCGWSYSIPPDETASYEIASGGWNAAGQIYDEQVIGMWDKLLDTGAHVAPVGGSDDHHAGQPLGTLGSDVGSPTTVVYARELSAAGIVEGIRNGRTVVKLQGSTDPMVTMTTDDGHMIGDTVYGSTHLHITVTANLGGQVQLFHNGVPLDPVNVTSDLFTFAYEASAPSTGTDRWRAEAITDQHPISVTGHIWIGPAKVAHHSNGCGSEATGAIGLVAILIGWRMRRRAA